MPFLKRHGCCIDFSKSVIVMSGQEIACVDKFGHPLEGGGQQCLTIERRDRGPSRSDTETQANPMARTNGGQSQPTPVVSKDPEAVQTLRANPVLANNVTELREAQMNLPGVLAVVYQAKRKRRRPNEVQLGQGYVEFRLLCQSWDSLWIENDGLSAITLSASDKHPEKKQVVCPEAMRRELIEITHQQTHTGVQQVINRLQLRWYWPKMGRDVWHRMKRCKGCQANKHGRPLDGTGWQDARWSGQTGTIDLVKSTPTLLKPRRQTIMWGRQRRGPKYEVVVPREEGLTRDERSPPPVGVGPSPPAPGLTPSLPDTKTAPEVPTPAEGGALSGESRKKATTHFVSSGSSQQVASPHWRQSDPGLVPLYYYYYIKL